MRKKIYHLQVKRVLITKSVLSVSVLPTQTPSFPLYYHAKTKQLSIPSFSLHSPHFPSQGAAKQTATAAPVKRPRVLSSLTQNNNGNDG